jgi:hypothetical protein
MLSITNDAKRAFCIYGWCYYHLNWTIYDIDTSTDHEVCDKGIWTGEASGTSVHQSMYSGYSWVPQPPCVVVGKSDFTLFLMETAKYFDFIN